MSDHTRPNIFPALNYRDAPAALEWLEKALGFRPSAVHRGPGDTIAHAEMKLGSGGIMFGSLREEPGNPWAQSRMGIYVWVPDVDAHYERARAAGAEIIRPLAETSYGAREYSVRDPEGNLWSFGTYHPDDQPAG